MFISKKESVKIFTEKSNWKSQIEGHNYGVLLSKDNPYHYSVYEIKRSEPEEVHFFFIASFASLKAAISHCSKFENPSLINDGFEIVNLSDNSALFVCVEDKADNFANIVKGYHLDGDFFIVGEKKGYKACFATKLNVRDPEEERAFIKKAADPLISWMARRSPYSTIIITPTGVELLDSSNYVEVSHEEYVD